MLGDLQVELVRIRHEVVALMEEASPALKRRAEMILATVWLGVTESKIRSTPDPEERRRLVNEFWKGRNTVKRATKGYRRNHKEGALYPQQEPRKAMP